MRVGRNALENVYSKTGKDAMLQCISHLGHRRRREPAEQAANGHFNPEKSRNVQEEFC